MPDFCAITKARLPAPKVEEDRRLAEVVSQNRASQGNSRVWA